MRIVATLGLGIFLAAPGCGSRPDPGPGVQGPTAGRPAHEATSHQPPVTPSPTPPPTAVAGTAPEVRIVGTLSSPRVAISVTNASDEPVQLARDLVLEVAHGTTWSTVDSVTGVTLRPDCRTQAPDCLTLVPGATLEPPAWLGTIGDAQCICERCVDAPVGRYRFVARTCSGTRIDGEPFELTR